MAAKHFGDSNGDRPLLNHRTHDSKGVCPHLNHSVFVRYTLRSLAVNRVRTAVTVVGVALATGLLAAVLVSVTSLRAALITQACASGGVWQAGFTYEDAEKIDELRAATGEHLDRLALRRDLGAAALSAESAEKSGTYLGVLSLPEEQAGTARSARCGGPAAPTGMQCRRPSSGSTSPTWPSAASATSRAASGSAVFSRAPS